MTIASAKVAIDKLAKLYEPLAEAKQLMADLEAAEQRLKEVTKLTADENNIVGKLKEARDTLSADVLRLRKNYDDVLAATAAKSEQAQAKARQDVKDIEAAGVAEQKKITEKLNSTRKALELLENDVEKKRAELNGLTASIAAKREEFRKFADTV